MVLSLGKMGFFMEVVSLFNGNTLIQGVSKYGFGLCLVANSFNFWESTRRE